VANLYHAIVWIDHQQAKIFHFEGTEVDAEKVQSSHPHQHLHHKVNSSDSGHAPIDKAFLKQVAAAVAQAGTILITGPAGAKKELAAYLEREEPVIAARVAAVETLDHPTNRQLIAFGRKYFKIEDRMHSQFRQGMHQ